MSTSGDLIDFDVIEAHKENIQALPSGRSAKKLAELFSPSPLRPLATPTPSDTRDVHDCIRAEYEAEIASISESDDPLDVYDRYVRWIFNAYPSAQATPQSQLHTVLERATKAFINAPQYKNDPRYLKLWLHYIRFFADAPRETFVFLARHSIGEGLALFYEEYAAWLEVAGRWVQAEEVYKLGIEREARPAQRLVRKFGEFEQRRAALPEESDTPSSPALPTMRPALAAKIDPFTAAATGMRDPQAPRQTSGVGGASAKPAKAKLQIFSDAGSSAEPSAMGTGGPDTNGWDNIGSLASRKKENAMEPKPWAGETLKAGGKKSTAPKMAVFKDQSLSQISKSHITITPYKYQVTVNPSNGKQERVFVDLQAVYPSPEEPGTELSFEEIWAANRGWLDRTWEAEESMAEPMQEDDLLMGNDENSPPVMVVLADTKSSKLNIHHDVVKLDENGRLPNHHGEGRSKKKAIEVNETQIIKAKLDSPSGPKMRKRNAEPTMTIHTKAATDDIYDIFNAPLTRPPEEDEASADDDDYETDGDYTSGAESTGTTRQITTSEAGDEVEEETRDDETADAKSVSEWSDFSTKRHIPDLAEDDENADEVRSQVSDLIDIRDPESSGPLSEHTPDHDYPEEEGNELATPTDEEYYDEGDDDDLPPRTRTTFVPIPPENYVPNPRPFRDPVEAANNRLPFMTPITERTESSLRVESEESDRYGHTKTPSRRDGVPQSDDGVDLESLSSPLREVVEDFSPIKPNFPQPLLQKPKPLAPRLVVAAVKPALQKGPIIKDVQCNPVDDIVRNEILEKMQPPLSSYPAFYDHRSEKFEKGSEIRKFAKSLSKSSRSSTDKTANLGAPVVLQFPGINTEYVLKKELGAGAFAPVYLVENANPNGAENDENELPVAMGKGDFALAHNRRSNLEALKMETPPTSWEFHMMRLSHTRLGPQNRSTASLSTALEMHLYQDEAFLFLPFHPHGTLLEVVNVFRAEASGVMDEQLAMFFTIELLRTVEALHAKQILHGDLKADNCLLRLDDAAPLSALSSQWRADGSGGWGSRGVTLIDFGRGIDMRAFTPGVQFIADWKTTAQDCAEMREGRPWTWQIDYHGLAGIVHCLLFGKYIETVRADAGGLGTAAGRKYKIRESLKRYWQTEIWGECFEVLLNPSSFVSEEEGARMPVLKSMGRVREKMEAWLEGNCERGVGLRSLMAKVEAATKARR